MNNEIIFADRDLYEKTKYKKIHNDINYNNYSIIYDVKNNVWWIEQVLKDPTPKTMILLEKEIKRLYNKNATYILNRI